MSLVILLLLPSMSTVGLSTWNETSKDFEIGEMKNTDVEKESLVLGTDPSFPINWTKVGDLASPAPRARSSMVFDSSNNAHILFGGGSYSHSSRNDTWVYNLSSGNWTQKNPAGTVPWARQGQAMVYDSIHNVSVLFGGSSGGHSVGQLTYVYNYSTNEWISISPYYFKPRARELHSMVFDPVNDMIILFGGWNGPYSYPGNEIYHDTWTYNMSTNIWTNMNPAQAPSRRFGQSMCCIQSTGLVVLYGGQTDYFTALGETWTYNLTTNIWARQEPKVSPPPRMGAVMATDLSGETILLFGGFVWEGGNPTYLNDLWSYDLSSDTWTELEVPYGPAPRAYASMTYDSIEKKMFLFGGEGENVMCDDFWSFDPALGSWEYQGELATPEPRFAPSWAYDTTNKVGVLFGGETSWWPLNDTWIYEPTANKWTERHPQGSPAASFDAPMCYDPDDGLMVLFNYAADRYIVWTYNVSTDIWSNRSVSPTLPWPYGACPAYDITNRQFIIFISDGEQTNETWTYSIADDSWINRTGTIAPSPRKEYSMTYDEINHLVILFGGNQYTTQTEMNDTWILDPKTFAWTRPESMNSPPPRHGHAMCYDSSRSACVIFGGASDETALTDTWVYIARDNLWINLTSPRAPALRFSPGIIYDTTDKIAVLFGGIYNIDLGDTWVSDLCGRFTSGTYTSAPNDTGGTAYFGSFNWNASTPAGTEMKFQLRTGANLTGLESGQFIGPDSTPDSYYTYSGQRIASIHNGSRWIQYRAFLTANSARATVALDSVTIRYNLLHEVAITCPAGGANLTGPQNILWSAMDRDIDALSFDLFLDNETGSKPLARDIDSSSRQWPWDTDIVPNGTYRIRIKALDENPFIPLETITVSDNFTIHHPDPPPPPNHLPHITLVSPSNNSFLPSDAARLQWNGSDPDGDPLIYTVQYSDRPFLQGFLLSTTTAARYIDLTDLRDNTTYYWTVSASDGKSNGTDIPAGTWTFTVKLPPVNIPVRFSSTPNTTAWVGREYTYNLTSTDEDGDIPTFSIVSAPKDMTLDSTTGKLRWSPSISDIGNHTITVQVSDGRGSIDSQTFTITVLEPPAPPQKPTCAITSPANNSKISGPVLVRGTALNGTLPITLVQLRLDGGEWQTAVGLGNWSMTLDLSKAPAGPHRIEARAFDGSLYSDTASIQIDVKTPEPSTTIGEPPWLQVVVIIAIAAGVGIYLVSRRSKGP